MAVVRAGAWPAKKWRATPRISGRSAALRRALRDFAEQGLVRLERGAVIVLDRDALRRQVRS